MKKVKKPYIKKGQLIVRRKKPHINKGRLILGSSQKTQKGGLLPLLLWFAPIVLNMLGNIGNMGREPPPPPPPRYYRRRRY